MDEEIKQKVANLTNALYEAGYLDKNNFTEDKVFGRIKVKIL